MKVGQPVLHFLSPIRLSHSLRPPSLPPDSLQPPDSWSVPTVRHSPDDLHGVLRFSFSLHPFRQDHLPRLSFPIPQHCHQVRLSWFHWFTILIYNFELKVVSRIKPSWRHWINETVASVESHFSFLILLFNDQADKLCVLCIFCFLLLKN